MLLSCYVYGQYYMWHIILLSILFGNIKLEICYIYRYIKFKLLIASIIRYGIGDNTIII